MNEKMICPLCGSAAPYGKCRSCGYIIPDDVALDYNTKLNDLDPEDYPKGEVMRNIMDDAPMPEKRRFDLMPDINDVPPEPTVHTDPNALGSDPQTGNMPVRNVSMAPPEKTTVSKREWTALAAVFLLSLLPLLPVEIPLFGGIVMLFLKKGRTELIGLSAVIAVILRIMIGMIWNGLI